MFCEPNGKARKPFGHKGDSLRNTNLKSSGTALGMTVTPHSPEGNCELILDILQGTTMTRSLGRSVDGGKFCLELGCTCKAGTADLVVPGRQGCISTAQPNPTRVTISCNDFIIQQQNKGQNREKGSSQQGERKNSVLAALRAKCSSHVS